MFHSMSFMPKKPLDDILQREFVACMFDYDGTLVERGYRIPLPSFMPELLQDISRRSFMAVCTARPFSAAFKHAHDMLGKHFDELKKKWVWICENGAVGYAYDQALDDFMPFYRVPWPEDVISLGRFSGAVHDAFDTHVSEIQVCEGVIILRPADLSTISLDQMSFRCETLERMGLDLIADLELEGKIRLGNSSLGIIFYGAEADKDRGALEFGKYLIEKGVTLHEPFRDIICFGDRAMKYGNDEYFLSGKFGTPVNVGEEVLDKPDLASVYDHSGDRLMGPRATSYLLRQLRFVTR